MPEIQDRIAFLSTGLTSGGSSFALRLGLSPTLISNIVAGRRSKPSYDTLEKIKAAFPQVDCNWLINGLGEPYLTGQAPATSSTTQTAYQLGHKQKIKQTTEAPGAYSTADQQLTLCLTEKKHLEQRMLDKDETIKALSTALTTALTNRP